MVLQPRMGLRAERGHRPRIIGDYRFVVDGKNISNATVGSFVIDAVAMISSRTRCHREPDSAGPSSKRSDVLGS